jgi:hypothetical protein
VIFIGEFKMAQRALHGAMESLQHTAAGARHMAQDNFHRFGKKAAEFADSGKAKAQVLAQWTRDEVCDRPVQTTLIAVGLACLVAACFVRR